MPTELAGAPPIPALRSTAPQARDLAPFGTTSPVGPAIEAYLLDPLAKDCPEDVPCRVNDGDLWFSETPAELDQAKAHCLACPARLACLAGALERREPWGVWGGEIFERGAVVTRKRPRGRPRKDAEAA